MEGQGGDAGGRVVAGDFEYIFEGDWEAMEGAEGLTVLGKVDVAGGGEVECGGEERFREAVG